MSALEEIRALRVTFSRNTGEAPGRIALGRDVLLAVADECYLAQANGRRYTPKEWRDHIEQAAIAGELHLYGIPVEYSAADGRECVGPSVGVGNPTQPVSGVPRGGCKSPTRGSRP